MPLAPLFKLACILVGLYLACGIPLAVLTWKTCQPHERGWLPWVAWLAWPYVVGVAFVASLARLARHIASQ